MRQVEDPLVRWIGDSWTALPESEPELARSNGAAPSFAVLQVPLDYAVSFRPGTRFGPEEVLSALNGMTLYCTDKRLSLESIRLFDAGIVDVVHSLEATYERIRQSVRTLPAAAQPIVVGGDHSLTDPAFRAVQDREPDARLGLIVFDAHFDARKPTPGREHSGHWLYTLSDVLEYRAVAQIGITAGIYSHEYMKAAEHKGVLVQTPYDLRRRGHQRCIDETLAHVREHADAVYISVDIDCLDKAFAPGTSSANPAGLMPYEVIDAVFEISSKIPVAGFDLVEVSPPLDALDYTSQLGAQIIVNQIAGVVAREVHAR